MSEAVRDTTSDIPQANWIDRLAPEFARPYLRLARMERPIGTWLLLIPCLWSVSLATEGWPDLWLFTLFAVGSLVMRGAGCTVNDIVDRDFDARVARTAGRPIASGSISLYQAFAFLSLQLLLGLSVLIQFNHFSIILGVSSLTFVVIYPFMKRITYWPQLFLGLTFNWGALMGWAAVKEGLALSALVLYAAGILWTLGYDTIYAHQDKEDDILVGIKSTALKFGAATPLFLAVFYAGTIALLALSGITAGLSWPYFIAIAMAGGHLGWQVRTVDTDNPKSCLSKFRSNRDFGLIVLVGIIAGQVIS